MPDFPDDGRHRSHPDDGIVPSDAAPSAGRHAEPEVPAKRRPGAPRGASNGAAVHLLRSKTTARERRDKAQRSAERDTRAALVAAGLADHPLARMLGKALTRLEAAAQRCEERACRRGWFDKTSAPSPAFVALTRIVQDQLGELRRMVETLAGTAPQTPREILHRVEILDDPSAGDEDRGSGDLRGDVSALILSAQRPDFRDAPRVSLQAQIADGRLAELPPAQTLDDDLAERDAAHERARRAAETTGADAPTELDTPHSEAPAANPAAWAEAWRQN